MFTEMNNSCCSETDQSKPRKYSKNQSNCSRVPCYVIDQSQEDCKQLRHGNGKLRSNQMTSRNAGNGVFVWGPILMVVVIATTMPHFVLVDLFVFLQLTYIKTSTKHFYLTVISLSTLSVTFWSG